MKLVGIALITTALGLLSIACQPATETITQKPIVTASPIALATPDELAAARENYKKHCSNCHGEGGEGGIVQVDEKRLKVPSLQEGHAVTHPDEKLAKQIMDGDDEMPAFKDKLSAPEIAGLVRLIRNELQKK